MLDTEKLTPFHIEFLTALLKGRSVVSRHSSGKPMWKATMPTRGQGLLPGGEKATLEHGVQVFPSTLVRDCSERGLTVRVPGRRFDQWRLSDGVEAALRAKGLFDDAE